MQQDRIGHLQEIMKQNTVDGFLISSTSNIYYLSGFNRFLIDHDGFLFVTLNNVFLITSPLYSEAVKKYTPHLSLLETSPDKWYTHHVAEVVKQEHIKKVGFEETDLRVGEFWDFLDAKIDMVSVPLRVLRMKKDSDEIEAIQKACQLTDATFDYILNAVHPGVTEQELATHMENYIKQHGGELGFPSIVGFGEHAAVPHHMTSEKKLETNSFVLFDFGAKVDSYMADMSRTVFIGTPSDKQRQMYETVKKAQEAAIEYITESLVAGRQSLEVKEIDEVARKVIEDAGFPTYPHSLGHGIGLEVHEAPILSKFAKDQLEENIVFTIEPGIYIPELGGVRIEDMFVIQDGKLVQLTYSPKDLIIV